MSERDAQDPLFGEPRKGRDSAAGSSEQTDEFEQIPPAATRGQLTLDPAFDYKAARRAGREPNRRPSLRQIYGILDPEQRLAAIAAIGMAVSLLTPWWGIPGKEHFSDAGISHLSFAELAMLLVCAALLLLLYRRIEARVFHLPLSDSTLAAIGGVWCCFLIVYRIFDRPGTAIGTNRIDYDPHWGAFVALGFAFMLLVAGVRGRRKYHAGESEALAADQDAAPTVPLRAGVADH